MARRALDFSDPFQGRRWLKYLRPDPVSGLRILPNVNDDGRALGFSLRSNLHGLRGPADVHAPNVISGTSFAMGFAVDNDYNWYDLACAGGGWFNLGLPVGTGELRALLDDLYRGPGDTLLFAYHPNIYTFTRNFDRARRSGHDLFAAMGWETGWWRCLALAARKQVRQARALRAGSALRIRHEGETYYLNALYNRFDFAAETEAVEATVANLRAMFARFRRVLVARVWLKQELVSPEHQNAALRETIANYGEGWQLLQERVRDLAQVTFHQPDGFTLHDYHPGDTHWNEIGNRRYAHFVRDLLAADPERSPHAAPGT